MNERPSATIARLQKEIGQLRKLGRTKRQPCAGIGGVIQRQREKRGWGLRDLAERSNISAGLLCRIESGHGDNLRWNTLTAIAKGLGTPVWELVKLIGENKP